MFKMTNEQYDLAKQVVQVVMPAIITMIGTIGAAAGWESTDFVVTILGAITLCLGTSLGISNTNYKKEVNDGK